MKRKVNAVLKPDGPRDIDFMTITFAEAVENHTGMQQIGETSARGMPREFLEMLRERHEGYSLHDMNY